MKLTYQSPESVKIGSSYPAEAFVLENSWDLEVLDLDKKLSEVSAQRVPATPSEKPLPNGTTKFQQR